MLYNVEQSRFKYQLIQCSELLYIVKGMQAPGYACVLLLPIR